MFLGDGFGEIERINHIPLCFEPAPSKPRAAKAPLIVGVARDALFPEVFSGRVEEIRIVIKPMQHNDYGLRFPS